MTYSNVQIKRYKVFNIYVNECSAFTPSNEVNWGISTRITCSTVNDLYYLNYNMYKLETCIVK